MPKAAHQLDVPKGQPFTAREHTSDAGRVTRSARCWRHTASVSRAFCGVEQDWWVFSCTATLEGHYFVALPDPIHTDPPTT
jgi:hypothetical protein